MATKPTIATSPPAVAYVAESSTGTPNSIPRSKRVNINAIPNPLRMPTSTTVNPRADNSPVHRDATGAY